MKHDLRSRALRAHHLTQKNITGEELAYRLKTSADGATELAQVGALIKRCEHCRLDRRERDVLKVMARVIARRVMMGFDWAHPKDIDLAAGKRTGWCGKQLLGLVTGGMVGMPAPGRVMFTPAGWAFVWATGLIKPTWKVPT